jgi:hypothetical protein
MPGAAPAINSFWLPDDNRTADLRLANISWLCLDSSSPSWSASHPRRLPRACQPDFVRPRSHPLARSHQRRPLTMYPCSDEPEIGSGSRSSPSDRRGARGRHTLLSEHLQQTDSLSRTVLEDETLGAPADAPPSEWRRLSRGQTRRKPSRALMTSLPPPVEFGVGTVEDLDVVSLLGRSGLQARRAPAR